MPQVLTWSDHRDELQRVHETYSDLVSEALWRVVRRMRDTSPEPAEQLVAEIRDTSGVGLSRLLLAPETSSRLRWFRPETLKDTADFLRESVLAEKARARQPITPKREIWTALGDARVLPSGEVILGPSIEGFMPLDLDSPYATTIDLSGASRTIFPPRPPLAGTERETVLDRLTTVQRKIADTSMVVRDFVAEFTKVLVLQKDEAQGFSSGSEGRYVGRSTISNPHIGSVDELDLAEAVVHEAIHSLLYMQEHHQPWVFDKSLYGKIQKVVSPWTGTVLPVRPYLQACFVWYGVLHFWCLALLAVTFPTKLVYARIRNATSGFLRHPLLENLEKKDLNAIVPEVKDAIEEMQRIVKSAGAGA